jgi:hypothetical protein
MSTCSVDHEPDVQMAYGDRGSTTDDRTEKRAWSNDTNSEDLKCDGYCR